MGYIRFTLFCGFLGLSFVLTERAFARKGSDPIYTDSFDLGAGGAALTRASRDGRMYANPALFPFSGAQFSYFGFKTSILSTQDMVDRAKALIAGTNQEAKAENGEETGQSSLIDEIFASPLRLGWNGAFSYLQTAGGIGVFTRFEPDIRAYKFGEYGLPEVRFSSESYHGAAFSLASRLLVPWLSLGVTFKYLYALEPEFGVALADKEALQNFELQSLNPNLSKHYRGFGSDAGLLGYWQGKHLDFSLAAKLDDFGGISFIKGAEEAQKEEIPENFKQMLSLGMGFTLHNEADAMHFAFDYRDITGAYEEELFKRIHFGAKLMLRNYFGVAAGIYHGSPSFGAELDLLFLRMGLSTYTRELGDHPGVDPRRMILASASLGF